MPEEFKDQELVDQARKSEHNDRATASRINGAKSKGPKTVKGKAKSSQNALKHGFRSASAMVINPDRQPEYNRLRDEILVEVDQDCPLQARAAELMIVNFWKFQQANELQVDLIRQSCEHSDSLIDACFSTSGGVNVHTRLNSLVRHEGQFDRGFHRGLKALLKLRKEQQPDRRSTRNKTSNLDTGLGLEAETPIQSPDCQLLAANCKLPKYTNEPKHQAHFVTQEIKPASSLLGCQLLAANGQLDTNEPSIDASAAVSGGCSTPTHPQIAREELKIDTNEPKKAADDLACSQATEPTQDNPETRATNPISEDSNESESADTQTGAYRPFFPVSQPQTPTPKVGTANGEPPEQPKPHWGADYNMRCVFSIAP